MSLLFVGLLSAMVGGHGVASGGASRSTAELVSVSEPAIVVIRAVNRDGESLGLGTGFVIDSQGLIATAYHVIGEARPIVVERPNGEKLAVTGIHASDRKLDLAILRVDAKGLPSLSLADPQSAPLPAGESVVALGHPLGLEHSVVTGLISAVREMDGRQMIQVAMPIEPGHSGGPLLDVDGKVRGIMVMKSAATDQLGFAVAVSELQRLLDRPNPMAMEQWMTIGQMDTARWTTLFGGDWRQRAGKIFVSQPGDGFGGRTLCLSGEKLAELPVEVGAWVKLNDERGAAGLVFLADGTDRHYGFYPSNGSLRLTCFSGPSVYSWDVLAEVHSPHYRPGEWNYLKVRLETDRIRCFVNDELAVESTEVRWTAPQAGLAKFRETQAEFRGFQAALQLPAAFPSATDIAAVNQLIESLPPTEGRLPRHLDPLQEQDHSRAVAMHEARRLRNQADALERLGEQLHVQVICRELAAWSEKPPAAADLVPGALLVARLDNPELDAAAYLRELERMTEQVRAKIAQIGVAPTDEGARAAIELQAIDNYLFVDRGYHGSRLEYDHPANSHLDRVIDDREGLPITLSVLYMELGRRLGLNIEGVGLPGHFIVRYRPASGEPIYIDVYERGERLTRDGLAEIVAQFSAEPLNDQHLQMVAPAQIVVRMLNNLVGFAQRHDDRRALGRYLEALVTLAPDHAPYRGLRAVLRRDAGQMAAAVADLDWILEHKPAGIDLPTIERMRAAFAREVP